MLRTYRLRRDPCFLRRARTDPEAFGEFYDAYARRVLVFFTWRVGNAETAFDLMSETFANALQNLAAFRGSSPEEEQGWLFAIARGQLSHYWRRGKVERAYLARLGVPVPELTSDEIDRIERMAGFGPVRGVLADALGALPEDQRRAIELRIFEELDYTQAAAQLGVSEDVVRARVSRGLRALRRHLDWDDDLLEATL